MMNPITNQHSEAAGNFALRFFHVLLLVFSVAGGLATALISVLPAVQTPKSAFLPWPFWVSSGFLLISSVMQHRSVLAVRREHQTEFRNRLFWALLASVGFVALQSFGLWNLLQNQPRTSEAASTGGEAFVFVLTVLHAMHVSVAIMFLTFVYLKSLADRYDHEYYWGVTFCAWFWHGLGIVWATILIVFLIAA